MWARGTGVSVLGLCIVLVPVLGRSELASTTGVSFAAVAVMLLPLAVSRSKLQDRPIWALALIAVIVGLPVRSVGSLISDSWRSFFFGESLPTGSGLTFVLLAVVCLTAGYQIGMSARWIAPTNEQKFHELSLGLRLGRFSPAALVALLGLASAALFISSTGGLDLSNISAKRGIFSDVASGGTTSSQILLRSVNELPLTLLVVMVGAGATLGADAFTRRLGGVFWAVLATTGLLVPFVSSQRDVLVSFFILGGIVVLRRGNFSRFKLALSTVGVVFLFGIISAFRQSRSDELGGVDLSSTLAGGADGLFRNRNLADLSKTLRVIEAVPDTFAFDNGARQFGSILGLIPRAIWPSKPVIGAGPEVSAELYGNLSSGVPPGLVAESFWSFGWGGLLVVLMVGGIAGLAERRISLSASGTAFAVRTVVWGPLLLDALGVGLGNAVIGVAIRALQVWLIVTIVRVLTPDGTNTAEKPGRLEVHV